MDSKLPHKFIQDNADEIHSEAELLKKSRSGLVWVQNLIEFSNKSSKI